MKMTSLNTILHEQAARITAHGTPIEHSERVYCVAFSPDGRYLVSGSVNRQVNIWEVGATELADYMKGHTKFVWSLAFSPDGKTLASTSGDGCVFLWDIQSRSHYRIEESHYALTLPLYGVAFSPTGEYFAAGCMDGIVRLWSTASRRPPWKLKGHTSEVYSVAFSPDGRFLASGGNDFTVRLWSVADKTEKEILTRPGCRVSCVIFSPDGRQLAYASTDTNIYIVDLASRESQILSGHQDLVWSIAFSPDSRLLISGANDHSVRLWDVASGRQIQILEGHQGEVNSVAFSPDGKLAASAADDQTVRVWDLSLFYERPEIYLRLLADQEKESAIDDELIHFINSHRHSLNSALGPRSDLETSIRWLRAGLRTENPPPLGLVHDLGLVLTAEKDFFSADRHKLSRYGHFLQTLRQTPIIRELKGLKLTRAEIGLLIAQLLTGVTFSPDFQAPSARPLLQSCRLLEASLRVDQPEPQAKTDPQLAQTSPSPFLNDQDQEMIKERLRHLNKAKIQIIRDLYAGPDKLFNPDKLAAILPLESLPPALTELYSQLLTITPKLTFKDQRGSQTYNCGGYHGLTHKGSLDNLALSEHLYAATLLQHRILNREALYYGREGEREKRRRITLIITQSGFEITGSSNHLARALTLAAITLLRNHPGALSHAFIGSSLTDPLDLLKTAGRQRVITWQEHAALNLDASLNKLKERLQKWQENYHQIDILWIIERNFAADLSRSMLEKRAKELRSLSRQRAWFITLEPVSRPPEAAVFFNHYEQILMYKEKITLL
ncbi:MAG: WD40 repeat domain-containing protein [Deltaproteobacteria bacterium]|nr:WD40 repeat domain-containing protein [Deltaproteobacteria bacterium]